MNYRIAAVTVSAAIAAAVLTRHHGLVWGIGGGVGVGLVVALVFLLFGRGKPGT